MITGLFGKNAISETTYAIESVVLEHLDGQLKYLIKADKDAFDCVSKIYNDEKAHLETSKSNLDNTNYLNNIMIFIIKKITHLVINFGMR